MAYFFWKKYLLKKFVMGAWPSDLLFLFLGVGRTFVSPTPRQRVCVLTFDPRVGDFSCSLVSCTWMIRDSVRSADLENSTRAISDSGKVEVKAIISL